MGFGKQKESSRGNTIRNTRIYMILSFGKYNINSNYFVGCFMTPRDLTISKLGQ